MSTLLGDLWLAIQDRLDEHSSGGLFFTLAPIIFFLEIPRYHLPGLILAVIHTARRLLGLKFVEPAPHNLSICVVVACRNEEQGILACVRSLLNQDIDIAEILVIDDSSDDHTYELAHMAGARNRVRVIRNTSSRGRGGKPTAMNIGLAVAKSDIVVSADADSFFDPDAIRHITKRFGNPAVGAVAGNVVVSNQKASMIARLQALEYSISIDIRKRWTDLFGCTLQASGAFGAFRRSALQGVGGWDQEVAEDTDISLRLRKAGWKLVFAPAAVCRTEAPTNLSVLRRQRFRWDRSGYTVYFRKHRELRTSGRAGLSLALELWTEWFFTVPVTLAFPCYLLWLASQGILELVAVLVLTGGIYVLLCLLDLLSVALVSSAVRRPLSLLPAALLMPFYKECLRWFRLHACCAYLLGLPYHDPFLPRGAWANSAPK